MTDSVPTPWSSLPHGWAQAIEALAADPGIAMVVGASNSGKTTWVNDAARWLGRGDGAPLAIVDADVGQSSIGPPATVALSLLTEGPLPASGIGSLPCHALSFVGSVSPLGHLLQLLVGTKRLVDKAVRAGTRTVLVDTTGLIDQGAGFQLKLRKVDLLTPRHLVVLQSGGELEPLLDVLADRPGLRIHRLEVSSRARIRSPAERAQYRAARFSSYFAGAKTLALQTSNLVILAPASGQAKWRTNAPPLLQPTAVQKEDFIGLLVGLNDSANDTRGLGVLQGVGEDGKEIHVLTPLTAQAAVSIRILQLGSTGPE